MSGNIYLKVVPKSEVTYEELIVSLAHKLQSEEFDVIIIDDFGAKLFEEIQELLGDESSKYNFDETALLEFLVRKGTPDASIVKILQRYIDKVGVDNELIIVDPYFYAPRPKNPNYVALLTNVLTKYLPTIDELIIVTLPDFPSKINVDPTIKSNIETSLKSIKPALTITSVTSYEYHDRYWMSNSRTKGIILGTSLNSLGVKYGLVDRLNKSDVRDIIASLIVEGLIT